MSLPLTDPLRSAGPVILVEALPAVVDTARVADLERDSVRLTAAERRWARRRVTTARGRVLALALPAGTTLRPGSVLHVGADYCIYLEAALEPVLAITPRTETEWIRVALAVGNQHGSLGVDGERLLVPDEPAMERLLERLDVPWARTRSVFTPVSTGTPH